MSPNTVSREGFDWAPFLEEGEVLLWMGQPARGLGRQEGPKLEPRTFVIAFVVVFLVVPVLHGLVVTQLLGIRPDNTWVTAMTLVLLLALVGWAVWRSVKRRQDLRDTSYAITNRRAISARSGDGVRLSFVPLDDASAYRLLGDGSAVRVAQKSHIDGPPGGWRAQLLGTAPPLEIGHVASLLLVPTGDAAKLLPILGSAIRGTT